MPPAQGFRPVGPQGRATPDTGKLTPRLYTLAHPAGQPGSVASQLPPQSNAPDNTPGGMQRLANGQVVVDVLLTDTSPSTLAQLTQAGGTLQGTSAPLKTVTATVAPDHLANLEALSQVRSVREDPAPQSNACNPVKSQGDTVMKADQARTNFNVNGAGQTVGVVSDSFNRLGGQATDVAGGELPGATNPCGFTTPVNNAAEGPPGSTDEGRAMAQIVHSLAPGANLAFENSGTSDITMANNLTDLYKNQSATVLTDDITYFDEPMYQDGPITNALTAARAANVPSFSSAANNNINIGGNDVASLEALQYQPDVNCPASISGYLDCHNFSPTNAPAPDDRPSSGYAVPNNGTLNIDLQWAQPWNGVTTEYDLFIIDQSGAVRASSTTNTITTQVPFQNARFTNTTGSTANFYVVVARKTGPQVRFKYVNLGREGSVSAAEFDTTQGNNVVGPTIFGHNGAASVYSLAASNWQTPTTPESFSSHGPLTTLFEPVPSTTAVPAQVVTKPDFTASDCVSTTVPGFIPFCGTSASAPHAAAIAALMLQRKPISPTQVGQLMTQTSTPMSFPRTTVGSGLLNAYSAVGAVPEPYNPLTPARITDTRPNSGFPNAGNTLGPGGSITVQVTGAGGVPATGVGAAVLNVTATNPTRQSFLTVWPTGATQPRASNLNFGPGQTVPNLAEVGLGTNGQVTVFNAAGSTDVVVDVEGYVAPAGPGTGLYKPLEPARIADTRPGSGDPNEGETLPPGGVINVQVTGAGGVPGTGVGAAVLNVTATNPTRQSFLTVWPTGAARPRASNVNFVAGQTVPNRVQVPVGAGGQVSIFNGAGSVDAVVDVSGYFTDNSNPGATGSQFTPVTPTRISDTRPNSGFPNAGETLGPRDTRVVQVAGAGLVPGSGLTAAVMNVTATNTTAPSFLTVWPFGVLPASSDLNWVAGQTVANLTAVQLNPFGQVQEFNAAGSMDAVVDVSGWYW